MVNSTLLRRSAEHAGWAGERPREQGERAQRATAVPATAW